MSGEIHSFFESVTRTWSHLIWDPVSGIAAIIDPVLNFCPASGRIATGDADRIIEYVEQHKLKVEWIIETHAHADHISAAQYLKSRCAAGVAIGSGITEVQQHFRLFFNLTDLAADGSQFDLLLDDGQRLMLGQVELQVVATPGHTSDSISLVFGNRIFVGDTFFGPGQGTARCDFPGGDARILFQSLQRLLQFPADTKLYLCHDYSDTAAPERAYFTVEQQLKENIHIGGRSADEFAALRAQRDQSLEVPQLMLPAVQINIRAGCLPDAEANGISYLKIPLDLL